MSATPVACPHAGSLVSSCLTSMVIVSAAWPCTDKDVLHARSVFPEQGWRVIVLKTVGKTAGLLGTFCRGVEGHGEI